MNQITDEEKEAITQAMSRVYEDKYKCRCNAINKKVNLGGIKKFAEIRNISLYKAREFYEENIEPFHTCCHLCCSCHLERFSENLMSF